MRIHTQVKLSGEENKLDPPASVFSIGSCFSACIPRHLERSKFAVFSNPCGTTYNPISIGNQIKALCAKSILSSEFCFEGEIYPMEHHGSFHKKTVEEQNRNIFEVWKKAQAVCDQSQILLVTLGTAFVFDLEDRVVNNCHRLPAKLFQERLLAVSEVVEALEKPLKEWLQQNESRRVVLTVSPVRHLRNGLQGNALSKSTLRVACKDLTLDSRCLYFPAYEIMNDELRGYRFYKDDLLHPSELAEQLIWERFRDWILSEKAALIERKVLKLDRTLAHRFQGQPDQRWIDALRSRMEQLEREHPELDWSKERMRCEQRIVNQD